MDIASAILTVLVVFAGIGLGILAGWRSGILAEYLKESEPRAAATSPRPVPIKKPANSPRPPTSIKRDSAPKTQMGEKNTGGAGLAGGLVVYEDGREVYRTRPENAALKEPEPSLAGNTPVLEEKAANERLIHRVEPDYPTLIDAQSEGPIVLEITVSADGGVSSATVVSGDPARAAVALSAVRKWRYEPRGDEVHTGFRTRVTFTPATLGQ
jgi:TonB family protein